MTSDSKSRLWTFDEALALVCDESQPLARLVAAFLSGAGRAQMGQFATCWRDMSEGRRRELVSVLAEMAEEDFQLDFNAIFRWALQSDDAQVRERAIEGLWEDEQPSLIEPLLRMLREDPAERVRAQAAISLGRFALLAELGDISDAHIERLRAGLLKTIENPAESTEVRRRAVEAIANLSDAPVGKIIREAYASPEATMRISAVFAMGRTADIRWGATVRRELRSQDAAMRYEAARAAGEMALRPALGELIGLLNDADAEVRQMTIWALGQVGGREARLALEAIQASDDEAMREAADEAMAELDLGSAPLDLLYVESDAELGDELEEGPEEGMEEE